MPHREQNQSVEGLIIDQSNQAVQNQNDKSKVPIFSLCILVENEPDNYSV